MLSSGAQTPSNKPHYIERVIVMAVTVAVAMMLCLMTIVMVLSLKFTIRQQSSFMVHGHGTLDGGHQHHHQHHDHYIEEIEIQPLFTLLHSQEEIPYIYLE